MAEYILQILRTQLMVVFSWGFNSPRKLPDDKGLSFIVNGFKYQGKVTVIYDKSTDLFNVTLENGESEEGVYLDCLVNVIDGLVERTADYKSSVEAEYGIHTN
jgi:sRNA-binding regulator protein Hfq